MARNSDTNADSVNIVKFTENDGLRLNADALADVLCQPALEDKPLIVIGIAGPLRTGKSFLLSFLMRYLRNKGWENPNWIGDDETPVDDGIEWEYGRKPHTKGILMWNEIFTIKKENGEEVAVLLVDTQGLFDATMTKEENVKIFALTVLLCSHLMLNVKEQINERELESLELFTEYSKTIAEDAECGSLLQDLTFLVRDWPFPDELKYGGVGGESHLEEVLDVTKHEQLNAVRKNLRTAFRRISCFLMPYPGDCVKKSNFVGRNADIHKDFLTHVQELARTIFDQSQLDMRIYNGEPTTGRGLWSLLQACDSNFQAKHVPQIENMTATVAKTNNRLACEEGVKLFEKKMKELQEQGDGDLDNKYGVALTQSLELFDRQAKFGSEELRSECRTRLVSECQEHFKTISVWDELRKIRARNMSSQKIHELWSSYKDAMRQYMGDTHRDADSLREIHAKHADLAQNKYEREAGLKAAYDEGHRTLLVDGINHAFEKFMAINEERSMLENLGKQEDLFSEYQAYLLFHEIAQQYRRDLEQFSAVYIDKEQLKEQALHLQGTYLCIFEANWRREGPNINDYRGSILEIFRVEYEDCVKQNERNEKVLMGVLEESSSRMMAQYREAMHGIVKRSYCEPDALKKAHDLTVEELKKNLGREISEVDDTIQTKVLEEATDALEALYPEFERINDGNKNHNPPITWDVMKEKLTVAMERTVVVTVSVRRFMSVFKSAKSTLDTAKPLLLHGNALVAVVPYVAVGVAAAGAVAVVAYCVYRHVKTRP